MKLIDAAERLGIQCHPDREKARDFFNSPFGKTECWHIVGGREIGGKKPMDIYGGAMICGTKGTMYFHPHDYVILYDEKGDVAKEWHPEDVDAKECTSDVPNAPGNPWKPKLDQRHWQTRSFVGEKPETVFHMRPYFERTSRRRSGR